MAHLSPNIIYVVCHDLSRTLGCYLRPVASPNLDRFASQGALFTTAFCSSPAAQFRRASTAELAGTPEL